MVKLREQEHKVLLSLKKLDGKASIEQIMAESGLSDAAVMRAALALQERKLLKIHEEKQTIVKLNEEGKFHAKNGLPERRLINALEELGKKASIEKVVEKANLEKHFTPIALGWIQKKHWAILDTKTNALQMLEKPKEEDDERLLKLLSQRDKKQLEI
jgi:phenylalanyl-tRNA synthetase alpha chain